MPEMLTVNQAFHHGLREAMLEDERVFVMGTDVYGRGGGFGQIKGLGPEFGRERVRDTPISEAALMAAGVGAALNGMRPVVDMSFMDFALGAMDELLNQAAKVRFMFGVPCPVVVRGHTGIALFAAQHNNSLEACFAHTPGLITVMPSNPADTRGLIRAALRADDPVVFLMHKRLSGYRGSLSEAPPVVPLGQAVVRRRGTDATLISYGAMAHVAFRAAEKLSAEGVDCEVVDLRTLWPVDVDTVLESVQRTSRALTLSDEPGGPSVAGHVAAVIQEGAFDDLDAPVAVVTARHTPVPHAPSMVDSVVPGAETVIAAVKKMME